MIKSLAECVSAAVRYSSNRSCVLARSSASLVQNYCSNYLSTKPTALKLYRNEQCSFQLVRHYAKGKDKKKEKGKAKVEVNEAQLAETVNVDSLKKQMEKAVTILKDDYVKHLSLRSAAGSVESIVVNLDGEEHTLQELAQIVRKNPKLIVVNMAIFPQAIPAALKAIEKSGMNLNPQQDGTTLYIPVPLVTKEHRENLVKNAKTLFIKCRDAIKDVQNKHSKSLKKKEGLSIDTVRNMEQQIVAIADKYVAEAQKIMETKQQELIPKE